MGYIKSFNVMYSFLIDAILTYFYQIWYMFGLESMEITIIPRFNLCVLSYKIQTICSQPLNNF